MALFVEHPVDIAVFATARVSFDMRCCAQIICDEGSKVIGITGRVHDDVTAALQAFDQATRLRAIAPLAGCNCCSDRQAERIHRSMDSGGQAAFRAANTGSFKPPF